MSYPSRGDYLHKKFLEFHQKNPHVYEILVKLARQWRTKHPMSSTLGIGCIFEVARWEVVMATQTDGDTFKLNNNHRASYARLIMEQEPDLKGVFVTKAQTSFGNLALS